MIGQTELVKNVATWGNGAGILLPKEWIGNQVKVILIDRTLEIKKEVLSVLEPYFEDIIGVYLVGSYARGEQEADSDIDIIAISKSLKKEIISGRYHISIATLQGIRNTIKVYPELIIPRMLEAKVILNPELLEELMGYKISKNSFKNFTEDSERIIKMCRKFIELDELEGNKLKSEKIIYSLILRLRGIFLIKSSLKNEKYSKKNFKKWLLKALTPEEFSKTYKLYKSIRDQKKEKTEISLETAKKLLGFLIKELKYLQ